MTWTTNIAAAIATVSTQLIPAAAQEVTGTITGTLALEPTTWYVTSAEGENLSGWQWVGNEVEVQLVGNVRRDIATASEGTLTISFRMEGNPSEMRVHDFSISLLPKEPIQGNAVYRSDAENADLDVEALTISKDQMAIGGSFSGQLILGGADDLILQDNIPNVTVDGNFHASIPRLSDMEKR